MTILYPMGYGTSRGTLDQMMAELNAHGHPAFLRRIKPWFIHHNGKFGIGDAWRAVQPTGDTFAPAGKSFHETQIFASGAQKCAAVDLVVYVPGAKHRAPRWDEVPKQGSAEAVRWGLHCNVDQGALPEPWHMQPIEIDGWTTWVNGGRKDPVLNYSIPSPSPNPPVGGTVLLYRVVSGDSYWKICEKVYEDGKATMTRVAALQAANANEALNPGDLINIPGKIAV